jgi:hypothetical protein
LHPQLRNRVWSQPTPWPADRKPMLFEGHELGALEQALGTCCRGFAGSSPLTSGAIERARCLVIRIWQRSHPSTCRCTNGRPKRSRRPMSMSSIRPAASRSTQRRHGDMQRHFRESRASRIDRNLADPTQFDRRFDGAAGAVGVRVRSPTPASRPCGGHRHTARSLPRAGRGQPGP